MRLLERILFPTDFSESANYALDGAIKVAKKFNSELILLHVLPEEDFPGKLREVLDNKMKVFSTKIEENGLTCFSEIVTGDYTSRILEFIDKKEANLVMLGAGREEDPKFKLGSNSEKIIQESSVPVWVIEKSKALSTDAILCPVDFSEESRIALDNAIHLCRKFESELIVLHVSKSYKDEYKGLGVDLEGDENKGSTGVMAGFESFLKEFNFTGLVWAKELRAGNPSGEIVNIINEKNIGTVVMGSTGKTGLRRYFLGSVSQKIIRQVPCSFVISKSERLVHLKLEKELNDIDALFQEGENLAKEGFFKEAIAMWKRCTYMNEFYLKAWAALAALYESMGDEENAKLHTESLNRIRHTIWDQKVEADIRGRHHLYK